MATELRVDEATASEPKGRVGQALVAPRAAAIAGVLFGALFGASLLLIQLSISPDELEDGSWLLGDRDRVGAGLGLIPFSGICFLWFIGVIRHRFGKLEDQFYSTVFIGSGLVFIAMIFAGAALTSGLIAAQDLDAQFRTSSGYAVVSQATFAVFTTYGLKMSGVFLFSLGAMWLRTRVMPKWAALAQFGVGAILVFGVARDQRAVLVFPLWILAVGLYLLMLEYRSPDEAS